MAKRPAIRMPTADASHHMHALRLSEEAGSVPAARSSASTGQGPFDTALSPERQAPGIAVFVPGKVVKPGLTIGGQARQN